MDDTDLKLSDAERAEAWDLLRSVADSGTTVLAVCSQAPEGAITLRTHSTDDADGTGGTDGTDDDTAGTTTQPTTGDTTTEEGTADAFAETGRA